MAKARRQSNESLEPQSGEVRKMVIFERKDSPTLTAISGIQSDNSAPQITEGTEIFSVDYALTKQGNRLIIEVHVIGSENANNSDELTAALFVDNAASAVASGTDSIDNIGAGSSLQSGNARFTTSIVPVGSTVNLKVRAGWNGASPWQLNMFRNFSNSQYNLGNTLVSFIKITEVQA